MIFVLLCVKPESFLLAEHLPFEGSTQNLLKMLATCFLLSPKMSLNTSDPNRTELLATLKSTFHDLLDPASSLIFPDLCR